MPDSNMCEVFALLPKRGFADTLDHFDSMGPHSRAYMEIRGGMLFLLRASPRLAAVAQKIMASRRAVMNPQDEESVARAKSLREELDMNSWRQGIC